MKNWLSLLLIFSSISGTAQFEKYFEDKTMRLDYTHGGNSDTEMFFVEEILEEPFWGGSKTNLVDTFEYGNYYVKVFNKSNDSLLYSRGYSTLFAEWQTTDEANKISRAFSETVVFPFPKKPVVVKIYSRNYDEIFVESFIHEVDRSVTILIPFPPPPAAAFTRIGYLILFAFFIRYSVSPVIPSVIGTPVFLTKLLASILLPISVMASMVGPIKVMPALLHASTRVGLSDRKPYPGCIASHPDFKATEIIFSTLRYVSLSSWSPMQNASSAYLT